MLIERIIKKLKSDANYKLYNGYSSTDLIIIVKDRFFQALRGLIAKVFFKKSLGIVFIGRNVKLRHAYKIKVGKSFILSDYSVLNGLSINGIEIGDNVSIGRNSTLICTAVIAEIGTGIKIGSNTGINDNAFLGGQGGIEIGSNVIIGPGVKIFSENHRYSDLNKNIKDQGIIRNPVIIGDNCWLGANVTVLSGVNVGEGCVIAAGAVLTKTFPPMCVIGGVPAKIIRQR